MKRLVLLVIVGGLLVSGCDLAMLQKMDVLAISENVGLLTQTVDGFQNVMVEYGKVNEEKAEEIGKINEKIDGYQETLVSAKEVFDEAPSVIEGVIAANQMTASVNPYAGVIDAVLKVIAGAGVLSTGVVARKVVKVGKEKKVLDNKYKAGKRGLERLRIAHPDMYEESYGLIGEERTKLGV